MHEERISGGEWARRCARRIVEVDPAIDWTEARRIAADMRRVERLAAMTPDAAVDFVRTQLSSERPDKYDRRGHSV